MGECKISASDLGTLGAYRMHSIVRKRKSGPGENNGYRCKRARDAIVPAQTPVRRRSALRREPIDDRVPGVAKKAAAAGANFDGHCRREQAEELREHGVSLVRGKEAYQTLGSIIGRPNEKQANSLALAGKTGWIARQRTGTVLRRSTERLTPARSPRRRYMPAVGPDAAQLRFPTSRARGRLAHRRSRERDPLPARIGRPRRTAATERYPPGT